MNMRSIGRRAALSAFALFGGLTAMVTEKGPGIFAGRADSILLKQSGTYTFPAIAVKAAHTGDFSLQVEIHGPAGRILASKWFTLKVVQ